MNDEQIKHMVDRFLSWRLPADFRPDAGITFKPMFNENTAHPMRHEPVGTNLFDATQAEAMVRYIVAGMPSVGEDAAEGLQCIACDKHFAEGDAYYPDVSGGFVHATCIGPERESYTYNGEPLEPGQPIPQPYVWTAEDAA